MNEFPPRGLGCLSFPAKWHGTRFVSGELDRIEIPLYTHTHIYTYTGRVSLALINSLQVRERGRGGCIMFRNGVQRVKFLPLRSPRRYVENFNGINTLQVLRKEERRLPGNIQRKGGDGVRFFVIFVTTNFENHGARLDDNDNAVIAEQGDEKRR